MTLIGLLQRGHQASPGSEVGDQRPTPVLAGGREWVNLLPDLSYLDATGPGRLQRTRLMQQVLEEAVQAMAGHPAEDADTSRRECFAPQ